MRSPFWVAFGVSTLFAVVALTTIDALAAYTRSFSANACVAMSGTTPPGVVGERSYDGQLVNTTPNSSLVVGCPIVSDTMSPSSGGSSGNIWSATTASAAHLHVWSNGASGVVVEACRTYFTGWGGTCVFGASAVNGINDLSFNPSGAWSSGSPNDGYYLKATVGPSSAIFSYTFVHP
jgi:hypothetical protein